MFSHAWRCRVGASLWAAQTRACARLPDQQEEKMICRVPAIEVYDLAVRHCSFHGLYAQLRLRVNLCTSDHSFITPRHSPSGRLVCSGFPPVPTLIIHNFEELGRSI
jgi:hypothetical protein